MLAVAGPVHGFPPLEQAHARSPKRRPESRQGLVAPRIGAPATAERSVFLSSTRVRRARWPDTGRDRSCWRGRHVRPRSWSISAGCDSAPHPGDELAGLLRFIARGLAFRRSFRQRLCPLREWHDRRDFVPGLACDLDGLGPGAVEDLDRVEVLPCLEEVRPRRCPASSHFGLVDMVSPFLHPLAYAAVVDRDGSRFRGRRPSWCSRAVWRFARRRAATVRSRCSRIRTRCLR